MQDSQYFRLIINYDKNEFRFEEISENKKELEKLANSLNENDNPVLMLVKLKE